MTVPSFLGVGKRKLQIKRINPGEYVHGRWKENGWKTVTIMAHVQPSRNKNDALLLPEGYRTRPILRVFSQCPIKMPIEGDALTKGDRFMWIDGFEYEVNAVRHYSSGVLDHYDALAVRMEAA